MAKKRKSAAPKKTQSSSKALTHIKHNIVPSAAGGGVAYLLSGVIALAVAVFAAVWIGNILSHRLHTKK